MTLNGHKRITITVVIPSDIVSDRQVFDSDVFKDMRYEVKGNMLVVYTPDNGALAVPINALGCWTEELMEIMDTWEGVPT